MHFRVLFVPIAVILATCLLVRSFSKNHFKPSFVEFENVRGLVPQIAHPDVDLRHFLAHSQNPQSRFIPQLSSYNVPAIQSQPIATHLDHVPPALVADHFHLDYETHAAGQPIYGQSLASAIGTGIIMNAMNERLVSKHFAHSVRALEGVDLRDGDVISLKADDGTYLKRYYPFPYSGYSGLLAYNKFVDPFSKFTVEIVGPLKIHLKAENGQYLKRFCCWNGNSVIAMYLDKPDPYSVFTVEAASKSQIRLKAEDGNYLKRVLYNNLAKNVIEVRPVKDVFGIFTVDVLERVEPGVKINDELTIYTGDVITLEADDGTYLKRYYPFPYGGYSGLLAYQKYVDPFSKFTVEVVDESRIHLKAENGQYLKRFCCWNGNSVIAMYLDKPDPYSVFTVEPTGSGSSIRLKAENGNYLKRVLYNSMRKNVIEVRSTKDVFGIFKLRVAG
eukprot:TRINITY_DN247_c0_g1_i1.p1 TRINITY_DN247_c0_g1~~TRINITY_DN247_c0_g1_i1.p1  ORF type:complete len:445 (+),score=64.33 TRINITY_DN247_c0_g1_i1:513-1847(+)